MALFTLEKRKIRLRGHKLSVKCENRDKSCSDGVLIHFDPTAFLELTIDGSFVPGELSETGQQRIVSFHQSMLNVLMLPVHMMGA